jgi:glycosyltransferase involved in cell wall biosynthesis
MNPKVSIIMLTYDRPQFIGRSVQSVLDQKFSDWELIVVDDGKGDGTEKIVRSYFKSDARLAYFHRSVKTGIAGAFNFGLAKARGKYIAVLDDDDYWATDTKLGKQVRFLDVNHEYVACGGGYVLIDEKAREVGRYLKPQEDEELRTHALSANPMVNSTTLFKRSWAESVGGYDETLREFADWDFWLKMGIHGKLYNFQEYFLYYRLWSGGASFSRQRDAAKSAFRILNRYRESYPDFFKGLAGATLYLLHAFLPNFVKKYSSPALSRLKKRIFSSSAKD